MDPLPQRLKEMTPLQRAVFALKETQARLDALERRRNEPIAIVGMACRFPGGVHDPQSYWRLLAAGVDAIGEVPPDRWDAAAFYDPDPAAPGKAVTRWGGFIDGIEEFDNHFFGISDREAARIDPQQRILLELTWEALEDAGLPPATLRGANVGVFVGISISEYGMMLSSDLAQTDAHAATGTSLCLAANRLSFAFGWQGPSLALDTACSSSLVALHLACQSIRNGECEMALVGGTSLLLSPIPSVNLTKAGFCASDGRVRAFDAAATGYVRSEGAGLVVLKPLSAALKNQDPIYAVVRGSAVNQNGCSNGMTAPSRAAQELVLREAYARANVSPGKVQFVETQGTGTRLGDAIEALALAAVLREGRRPGDRCAIGSVKTNIGHLEAASGIASVMKVALGLHHRQLVPNLHFHTPNPDIPFAAIPLQVQQKFEPWPDSEEPRLAGVSAFGFGGSNAHAVLEEAPAAPADAATESGDAQPCLLPLSARTEKALRDLAERCATMLRSQSPRWSDVCYSAARHRDHHDCRLAILAGSHQEALELLEAYLRGETRPGIFAGRKPFGRNLKIAFLYGGQLGNQTAQLADLAKVLPGLSAASEQTDAVLRRIASLGETAMNTAVTAADPVKSRPALLALQLTLAAWWHSAGVTPDVVLGEGVGELAAASTAGILTADEALQIIAAGGQNGSHMPSSRPASLPFYSTVDGQSHLGPDLDAAHWRTCLDQGAGLTKAVAALGSRHVDICLQVGPQSHRESIASACASGRVMMLSADDAQSCLAALGRLYAAGADLAWQRLAPAGGRYVRLPSYPWQRQRLWTPARKWTAAALAAKARSNGQGAVVPAPRDGVSAGLSAESPEIAVIHTRPDLRTPYVAPRTKLEEEMAQSWSDLLHIDRIGVHDNFFELGGDSLQATILLNRLREQLGEALPGHVLFQLQTIDDLAAHLRCHYAQAILRRYPEEAIPADSGSSAPIAAADASTASPDGAAEAPGTDTVTIPRLARDDQAEELLARVDELSDAEVDSLLGEVDGDPEVIHE